METQTKQLTHSMIESSPEIQNWLNQFDTSDRITAITLLSHLKFVSRDAYSDWLLNKIRSLDADEKYALYAVRKFSDDQTNLWDEAGKVVNRPGDSLGSEDLVYSIVANAVRSDQNRFFRSSGPGRYKRESYTSNRSDRRFDRQW